MEQTSKHDKGTNCVRDVSMMAVIKMILLTMLPKNTDFSRHHCLPETYTQKCDLEDQRQIININ